MATYALVDASDRIVNVLNYDGTAPFTPPAGLTLIAAGAATPVIGGTYSGGIFSPPAAAPAPVLTLAQQAGLALSAGVTLTLSGSMTLGPTLFPCDANTQAKLLAMDNMAAKGVLPTGQTAYAMKDSAGLPHEFTAAQYQAVVAAIAAYTAALILIVDGISTATALPSPALTVTV